jgi:1-deoxy-D-xylulose-5-phosphate synthase
MMATAAAHDDGPIALRYPRGEGTASRCPRRATCWRSARAACCRRARRGDPVLRRASGRGAEAAGSSRPRACRSRSPMRALPSRSTRRCRRAHGGSPGADHGGAGRDAGLRRAGPASPGRNGQLDGRCAVRTLHLPDRFIDQASPADMYADAGLTSGDIAAPRWRRWGSHPCVIMERTRSRLTRRGLPKGKRRPERGAVFDSGA